ncbi:MAG: arginine-ornithine antiporter, partial [Demequina sp.]
AEVLFAAASGDDAPRALATLSPRGVPLRALTATSLLSQVFLVIAHFSRSAFDFSLELTSAVTILPDLLTAAFALKLALGGTRRSGVLALTGCAVAYTCYLVYAMGLQSVLIALVVYAPSTLMYWRARRERGLRLFTSAEAVLCAAVTIGAVIGIAALASGRISF